MTVLRNVCVIALLLVIAGFVPWASAQTGNASLSGRVTDPQGAVVPHTAVEAINDATNVKITSESNSDGLYYFSALPPGSYRIVVSKDGFKQIIEGEVSLHTQDSLTLNFALQIGSVNESVTVNANGEQLSTDSPAVSMTVTHEFVEDMPLNGRSFQDLIQLAPGTVSAANGSGYYSIDGQRTDANNFTVDGVSANLGGYNNTGSPGLSGLTGNAPSQTALGTTQSLASIDSLQEFKIQTSGYAAEYGRTPGGQVAFSTRSGTNDVHGSLFEYLRNTIFDANTYSNDYFGLPKTADHQNDFGGTLGGPLIIPKLYDGKDRTFFFISYERLQLLLPASESEYVPTQAFRQWASPSVQPYLNASPLPNPNSPGNQDGCTIPAPITGQPTACDALFAYAYSYPNNVQNISVRLDHSLSDRIRVFVRYADTPSSVIMGAEQVSTSTINTHSWTFGLTADIGSRLLNDLRFNYSNDGEDSADSMKPIGGAVPVPRDLLIPPVNDTAGASGVYFAFVPGSSLDISHVLSTTATALHQYQLVDSLTWIKGNHSLKFGGDWRRLHSSYLGGYGSYIFDDSLADIQQGYASSVQIQATASGTPIFDNLSLYVQDHWRISPRLTLDYGVRWEFNPPPGPSNGHYPVALTSGNLATATLAPEGTPPYEVSYRHFAPRFGFAWSAIPAQRYSLTVRGGFGIFYDTGQNLVGNAYSGSYPFQATGPSLSEVPFPLTSAVLAPPSLDFPLTPPYPILNGLISPNLTLPYTEQWNLSIDEALNSRNTLTTSYAGNNGKKLLFTQFYNGIPGNPLFTDLNFTSNAARSNYNALQVQDVGRIVNGLDVVASFTWAHALDNASTDLSQYAPIYGNSDNDIRRMLNVALNYQTHTAGSSRWVRGLTHGWVVANRFSTQSGYPIGDISQDTVYLPDGARALYSPDIVPGVPIYLHGSAADVDGMPVPGSWRLNRAAFACTTTGATSGPCTGTPTRQGTLGRNFVRQPGFWALNTALQRSFPIKDQINLIFRAEAFNIFNHPNLGFPNTSLSSSTFGQLEQGTTTIGSPNPLYAMGAARSLQFGLKLQF